MRVLPSGDYCGGLSDAFVNLTLIPGFIHSGATCFLSSDTAIFQGNTTGLEPDYHLYQVQRASNWSVPTLFDGQGQSVLRAGAGNWVATLASRPPVSRGLLFGQPLQTPYTAQPVLDVGLDGSACFANGQDFTMLWANGQIQTFSLPHVDGGSVRVCQGAVILCQFPGPTIRIISKQGSITNPPVWGSGQYFPMLIENWLMYYADGYGLLLHPVNDKTRGYQFPGNAFYGMDFALTGLGARIVSSLDPSERLSAIEVRDIPLIGVGMQPIQGPPPPEPTPIPPEPTPIPPEPTPIPPEPTPVPPEEPTMPYSVIYPGTDLSGGTLVQLVPHPQGLPYQALQRADGEYATIATFTPAPLGFKVVNPPGGGEAFIDAGNQFINIDGNGLPHSFLKAGNWTTVS